MTNVKTNKQDQLKQSFFPVQDSTFCAKAVGEFVKNNYKLKKIKETDFISKGVNDVYKISTAKKNYFLRISKLNWRDEKSFMIEAEKLEFLQKSGISVNTAHRAKNNSYVVPINAYEGRRFALLFKEAKGKPPIELSKKQAELLGSSLGKMHFLTKKKSSVQHSLKNSSNESLIFLEKYAEKGQVDEFISITKTLTSHLKNLPDVKVFCHGDLHAGNYLFKKDQLTLMDFDMSFHDSYYYDLSSFYKCLRMMKANKKEIKKKEKLSLKVTC
jgi:Ser/Thr protein kinase RdoA (MazF antagonist)